MSENDTTETPAPEAESESESEFRSSNPANLDPQDFPPHTMSDDEKAAVAGRLSDVDADYAPEGSDQAAQSAPRPEATETPEAEPEEESEGEESEVTEEEPEAEAEEPQAEDDLVGSLTVPELQAELERLGVEYERTDRKAELQQKLRDKLNE
jgi:hypothetical protein